MKFLKSIVNYLGIFPTPWKNSASITTTFSDPPQTIPDIYAPNAWGPLTEFLTSESSMMLGKVSKAMNTATKEFNLKAHDSVLGIMEETCAYKQYAYIVESGFSIFSNTINLDETKNTTDQIRCFQSIIQCKSINKSRIKDLVIDISNIEEKSAFEKLVKTLMTLLSSLPKVSSIRFTIERLDHKVAMDTHTEEMKYLLTSIKFLSLDTIILDFKASNSKQLEWFLKNAQASKIVLTTKSPSYFGIPYSIPSNISKR